MNTDMHMYSYPNKETVVNAIFELAWNDRKLEATDFNFLSLIYIDLKGFSFKVKKSSLALKC